MPSPDVSTPARAAAVRFEDLVRHDPVENGALIAADGTELLRRRGSANQIPLMPHEFKLASGATFTHNHPGGTGPSVPDALICADLGMVELRVVTATHRHWLSFRTNAVAASIPAEYAREEVRVERSLRDEVRRNLLHPRDFPAELVHRTWLRVSATLGFIYQREQS